MLTSAQGLLRVSGVSQIRTPQNSYKMEIWFDSPKESLKLACKLSDARQLMSLLELQAPHFKTPARGKNTLPSRLGITALVITLEDTHYNALQKDLGLC